MDDTCTDEKESPIIEAPRSWRDPPTDHFEDMWHRFVRVVLFPVIVARPRVILALWLVVFGISAAFGPQFLESTRSDFDLPAGSPSDVATKAYSRAFPNSNSYPPVFIVQYTNTLGASVLTGAPGATTRRVASALANFSKSADVVGVIDFVSGFYELSTVPSLALLAATTVSPDNTTLLSSVIFAPGTTQDKINAAVTNLIPFAAGLSDADVTVSATGLFALFSEMTASTKSSFLTIDAVVLPVATIILGLYLRSYRHMAVAFAALGCTLLLAFAIMRPIAAPGVININPFAPSIMLSLGIAVTFDYSLFLLSRFREERIVVCRTKEEAVYYALAEAGEVIFLSGSTLAATFLILVFFPANFLVSVGWTCAIVVMSGVLTNLTLSPAFLIAFDCLSYFDALPSRRSCCCRVPSEDPAVTARANAAATALAARSAPPRRACSFPARPALAFARGVTSPWVRWVVVVAAALITIPFAQAFRGLIPSSDDYLVYLIGSRSLTALGQLKKAFPEGALDPYYVLVDTSVKLSTSTPAYYAAESAVVARLLETQAGYINNASVTALSFFQSAPVSFNSSMRMLNFNASSADYDASPTAVAYRALVGTLPSSTGAASVIKLTTIVSPRSAAIVGFIRSVRVLGTAMAAEPVPAGAIAVKTYLVGGTSTDVDVQDALYSLVPLEVGMVVLLVLLVVGASFRSVLLAVRLIITIFLSLVWVFGLMVMVYQRGPEQDAFIAISPTLSSSKGLYWIIPVLSFSVLVGLALDYDILLVARTADFRTRGWSDRVSMCLAVEQTGSVITTAGIIMIVSFVGLLIPPTIVLNQYGFALLVGVAIDTFLMRPIVVPAAFSILGGGGVNWWPRVMLRPQLTEAEEWAAIDAGHDRLDPPKPSPSADASAEASAVVSA